MRYKMMNFFLLCASLVLMDIGGFLNQQIFTRADHVFGMGSKYKEQQRLTGKEIIRETKYGISIIQCNLRCLSDKICTATNFYFDVGSSNGNCELLFPQGNMIFEKLENAIYTQLEKPNIKVETETENIDNAVSSSTNDTAMINEGSDVISTANISVNQSTALNESIIEKDDINNSTSSGNSTSFDTEMDAKNESNLQNELKDLNTTELENEDSDKNGTNISNKTTLNETALATNEAIFENTTTSRNETILTNKDNIENETAITNETNYHGELTSLNETGIAVDSTMTSVITNLTNVTSYVNDTSIKNETIAPNAVNITGTSNENYTEGGTKNINETNLESSTDGITKNGTSNNETSIQNESSNISSLLGMNETIFNNEESIKNETALFNAVNSTGMKNQNYTKNETKSINETSRDTKTDSIAINATSINETSIQNETFYQNESSNETIFLAINETNSNNEERINNETSYQNGASYINASTSINATNSSTSITTAVISTTKIDTTVATCTVGYVLYSSENICYRVSSDKLTWLRAKTACENDGALLFNINTTNKLAFVSNLTTEEYLHTGMKQYAKRGLYWSNDVQVTSTVRSELQVKNLDCDFDEDCCSYVKLTLGSYQLMISEESCLSTRKYICEKPAQLSYL